MANGKFIKHYKHTDGCQHCLPAERLEGFLRAPDSTIYITSENGLYEYRAATDDFIGYHRDTRDSLTFPTNYLAGFAMDSAGKLWIGTDKGLCVFNTRTKKVEKLFDENNIMGGLFRVCLDDYQNVWFNATSGSWCWLRSKDRLIHISPEEGMPKNDGIGFFMKGKEGCVYNGCVDAIVKYYPKKLMSLIEPSEIPIAISEISVNNKQTAFDLNGKGQKTLTLIPAQSTFSVDFAVLNYEKFQGNKYYYRLLPADKQWRQNENGHLSFYQLPPGQYQLEVKGGNEWTGDFAGMDRLLITVRPHWWQTWWFLSFSLLAIAGIVVFFVKRRVTYIRKEAANLQQQTSFRQRIAETEMQALRAQMNPHFIFNSLNSIENFIMNNDRRMASDYFSKFASLIRMILDSSRNELVPFTKDMQALLLYVELEQLRYDNKFSYQSIIDPLLLNEDYNVPPLLIQPYVENAIRHGLSQSEKQGLKLMVVVTLDSDNVIYTIQDNGVGRKKSEEYRLKKNAHKSMGMQITLERITILNQRQNGNGKVTVTDLFDEDGEPAGTKVEVIIKLM